MAVAEVTDMAGCWFVCLFEMIRGKGQRARSYGRRESKVPVGGM